MGQIRNIRPEEFEDSLALSQFAFQYSLSGEEIEKRKKRLKPEQVWVYEVNEKIASKLHLFPFKIFINDKELEMGGIAGVATWPEFRRQGMVEKLLLHSLQEMKNNGQVVSMLAPFSFDFYRRYGWDIHCEYRKYFLETKQLPLFKKVAGTVKRIEPDITLLQQVYEAFARRYNGMLKRDREWWENSVLTGKPTIAVYYNAQDEAEGYIIYEAKNKEMTIEEFIYVNEECRQGLWNFVRNHDSMVHKATVTAPIDDSLAYILSDPNVKQEIITYFMFRIVDVEGLLKQYAFTAGNDAGPLFLHITDEYAPWNNAIFQVDIAKDGTCSVKVHVKSSEEAACVHPPKRGLICDIQTLSLMLLGYKKPSFLSQTGRLIGNEQEIEMWEKLIPQRTAFLYDFF